MRMTQKIISGDILSSKINHEYRTIITSPPYFKQREYGSSDDEIGREPTVNDYLEKLTNTFSKLYENLTDDGSLWIVIGDVRKNNRKLNIPHKLVEMLVDVGYVFRDDVIWHKPNNISGSSKNGLTSAYEFVLFFSKSKTVYTNLDSIRVSGNEVITGVNQKPPDYLIQKKSDGMDKDKVKKIKTKIHSSNAQTPIENLPSTAEISRAYGYDPEKYCPTCYRKMKRHATRRRFGGHKHYPIFAACNPNGKNPGNVWSIATKAHKGNEHFAMFPEELIEQIVSFASEPEDWILDPFMGGGTTGIVSEKLDRNFIGVELYPAFIDKYKKL